MSRLARYVNSPLVSEGRVNFLTAPYIRFGGIKLSRVDLASADIVSSSAMTGLIRILDSFGIKNVHRLNDVGMYGLAACEGVGEAKLWAASVLVELGGFDVVAWIGREDEGFTAQIKRATQRTRGRKDPAPSERAGAATGRRAAAAHSTRRVRAAR